MSTDTGVANESVTVDQSNANAAAALALDATAETGNEQQQHQQQTEGTTSNGLHSNGNNPSSDTIHQDEQDPPTNQQNNYEENPPSSYNKNDLEPEYLRKVFIGGLSYKTDDATFRNHFSKYGEIVVCNQIERTSLEKSLFSSSFLSLGLYHHA